MSTPRTPEVGAAGADAAEGDWIFPLSETAGTTRAALVSGASALSLVLMGVLTVLGLVLTVTQPGNIVPWMPLALIPLAAGCVAAWRWEPIPVLGYVAIALAAIGSFVALTIAVSQSPAQAAAGTAGFVLSMTTNVAVLTGAASDRWSGGIAGALGGFALAEGTIAITASFVELPYRIDVPPIAIALGVAIGYAVVPLARARARSGTDSLERADRRTRTRRLREVEGRESIAVLHDTLLGELATLAVREPGPLTDAERTRLESGLESSAMLPLLRDEPAPVVSGVGARLVSIGAAGGVKVVLEGETSALDRVAEPAGSALRSALEQCVVNVARHAGVAEAWVAVGVADGELSVTVVDEGVGFDPGSVPHDRLGLSESVRGRVERSGGTVRVWSSPGAGTSVHLVVPMGA